MMAMIKLTLYAWLCTCFVCMDMMEVNGKRLENPPCNPQKTVKFDQTCEVCSRSEHNGVCHDGYKCSEVESDFDCNYTRLRGWKDYTNENDIAAFKPANHSGPLPVISAISVYQRNQSDSPFGYPALKLLVNVPYMLFGPGQQEGVPESMRMVLSSVEDIEYRDSYYYGQHITRLYRFPNYRPTSYEHSQPKQVGFQCLTGLDICGDVRVYIIQLTTYAASSSLYIEQNFTATAYIKEEEWFPIIATTTLPNNSVYVVFSPRDLTGVTYEIFLKDKDGHRKSDVENFVGPAQKYSCMFNDVAPGTYRVHLLVKYAKRETEPVSEYRSAVLVILGEKSTPSPNPNDTDFDLPAGILVIGISVATAIGLLILLYRQRNNRDFFKLFCRLSTNRQESRQKSLLLYVREAEKFVPCIRDFLNDKLSSMEVVCDLDWEKDQTRPFDLFQRNVKQCSHLLVLWSPSASAIMSNPSTPSSIEINPHSTVQDYFKEAITFSKDLSTTGNLKIVLLYIPGYADRSSVSGNIGEHKMFDLTLQCKQLCKYLTGDKSEFNTVPDNALQLQFEKILNPPQEEQDDKLEVVKHPASCPVHSVEERCHLQTQSPNIPFQSHPNYSQTISEQQQGNGINCYHASGHHYPQQTLGDNHYSQQTLTYNHYAQHMQAGNCHPQHMQTDNCHPQHMRKDNCHPQHMQTDNCRPQHMQTDNCHPQHTLTYNDYPQDMQADDRHLPHTQADEHHSSHTRTYNDNGSRYVHQEPYVLNPNITQDPSAMVPLLNPESNIDTDHDQGYVSKPSMELQNQFLELNLN